MEKIVLFQETVKKDFVCSRETELSNSRNEFSHNDDVMVEYQCVLKCWGNHLYTDLAQQNIVI